MAKRTPNHWAPGLAVLTLPGASRSDVLDLLLALNLNRAVVDVEIKADN